MSIPTTRSVPKRLYARLLRLYPRAFYDEFAADMQADFADALEAAEQRGGLAALGLVMRETGGLVRAVAVERRRSKPMTLHTQPRLGWAATAFALGPFALYLLIIVPPIFRLSLPWWFGLILLGFLIVSLLIGLVRGLPDWCLPYVGMCFGAGGLFAVGYAYWALKPLYALIDAPWWNTVLNGAVIWWGMLVIVPVFLAITALARPLRPFYARVRGDWTVLAFALYGSIPIALLITFDEYIGEEPFVIAATLVLMLGGYLFLHSRTVGGRALILGASITLAMGLAAFGKALLFPRQEWVGRFPVPDEIGVPWGEVSHALALLGWGIVFIILSPALLDRILALFVPPPAEPA